MATSRLVSDQKKRELEDFIESKIKSAEKQQPATRVQSNVQQIASIRENRKNAKESERQKTAHQPTAPDKEKTAEIIPLTTKPDDYSFPDDVDELFEEDD